MPSDVLQAGVSVVVPVYRGPPTLPTKSGERVELALIPGNHPFEIILVDDGSPDDSWKVITDLAADHGAVRGLRLGRNYGQHAALLAGTRSATFSTTVTLDDDLQNPPEEIPRLLAALTQGDDVVYGVPISFSRTSRRLAGRLARWSIRASGIEHAPWLSSFRAFRTDLRRSFNVPIGPAVDIDSLLTWGTTRFGSVKVAHAERKVGVSNYTMRRLLVHAFDFLTGYSSLPLRIATFLGLGASGLGVVLLGWVLGHVLFAGDAVSGFPFVASTRIILLRRSARHVGAHWRIHRTNPLPHHGQTLLRDPVVHR